MYDVVIGEPDDYNRRIAYRGKSRSVALRTYRERVADSVRGTGDAAGRTVAIIEDGRVIGRYEGGG